MVEWKELGQLGKFENIGTDKKINEGEKLVTLLNYVDVYHHKYIDSSVPQMQVSASDKKIEDCTVEKGDIFVTPSSETVDDIGHASVITETIPNAVYSYHIMRYRMFEKNMLLSYYINYAFDTENVKRQILKKAQGLTRFGLSKDKFASIQIPIPSLQEQTRIVGILDTFTASIENLKEQIAQRRKQYEYYRDELLNLEGKEGVEMKTLGEVCDVITGGEVPENTIKGQQEPSENHPFAVYANGKETYGYADTFQINSDAVCISSIGANTGAVYFKTGKFTPAIRLKVLIPHSNLNTRFLYYESMRIDFKGRNTGSVPNINANYVKGKSIHLLPLSEQSRIVSILDTFEASIANLEAQLKEREKQYEYYRNKLLTFE